MSRDGEHQSDDIPWMRIVTPEEAASPEWEAKQARDAFRRRILETLDMIAVMRDYMRLQPQDRQYSGACPFHHDRGKSLWVQPERGLFKCFECGVGGTLIQFFQRLERIGEAAATAYLAELAGVSNRK